jgi:hypothetical protein
LPSTLLPGLCHLACALDIRILRPFVAAGEQHHDYSSTLRVIHAIAGTVVDAQLVDPAGSLQWFRVTVVALPQPRDARIDPCSGLPITKPGEPLRKGCGLQDFEHGQV